MTRALLQTALLLSLPFLTGCATGPFSWYYTPAVNQICTDLPVGTPQFQVDAYLDQHEIEHHYLRATNQITAHILNVRRDALVRADLTLTFSFDEARRLRDIHVEPAYIAP